MLRLCNIELSYNLYYFIQKSKNITRNKSRNSGKCIVSLTWAAVFDFGQMDADYSS